MEDSEALRTGKHKHSALFADGLLWDDEEDKSERISLLTVCYVVTS